MSAENFDIQSLVQESGIPRRTIYFYVQQGILPPPQGAGLAAHYTGDHLLRLQLIPILRGQGLRLDEIRERFSQMNEAEMRQALVEAQRSQPQPAKKQAPQDRGIMPVPQAVPSYPPGGSGWGEQQYIQYHLPAGITVNAPAALSPADRQRLNLLLQSARQIFTGGGPLYASLLGSSTELPSDDSDNDSKSSSEEGKNA